MEKKRDRQYFSCIFIYLEEDLLALWPDITAQNSSLFVIDCQEKLMPKIWRSDEVVGKIKMLIKGFKLLDVPIIYSEQYPKGLGSTVAALKEELEQTCFEKTHF